MEAFSLDDPVEQLAASVEVTSQLAGATNDRTRSLLPTDLQTTNVVLDQVIAILEDSTDILTEIDAQPDEVSEVQPTPSPSLNSSTHLAPMHLTLPVDWVGQL